MSKSKSIDRVGKGQLSSQEVRQERPEISSMTLTPVKRQMVTGGNIYQALSPLPLPPKMESSTNEGYGSYSKEMIYIETPICKQHPKITMQEDQPLHYTGIVNKIIFESSEQDNHNNSSSVQSSDEEEESDTLRQEEPEEEEEDEEEKRSSNSSQEAMQDDEEINAERVIEKEVRVKKANKSRSVAKEVNPNKKVFCNCKKTKCLKLYCDCFRLNQTCDGCNCTGCHNLEGFTDERNHAILALMDRNPDPFGQKIEDHKHVKGCNCKKSNCLKKYCECYQAGLKCGQNCKCEECKNMPPPQKPQKPSQPGFTMTPESEVKGSATKSTAKKERRMLEI